MTENENERQKIIDYVQAMLGGGMIDVELDPIHYNTAIDRALAKFRQRSSNAVEESFGFLMLELDQNEYILPKEVTNVRQIFRRSIGSRSGGGQGGTLFEPFNLAYSNTYLLTSSNMGGLATYYAFASYQKLVGKMFGSYIGEVYRRNHKATWGMITLNNESFPGLESSHKELFWPWSKVFKRITAGDEENVWHYYQRMAENK